MYDTHCQGYRCVFEPRLHLPRGTSTNWLTIFILCLRRQYAATVAIAAATQPFMPVHEVCLWTKKNELRHSSHPCLYTRIVHIAKKAAYVFSSHDCIFHVEQVPTDWQFLFSACGVNMLPPWPLPLRHSHSCLYTRSVFERKKMNCDTVVIHACTRGLSFEDFFLIFASVRPGHAHDT